MPENPFGKDRGIELPDFAALRERFERLRGGGAGGPGGGRGRPSFPGGALGRGRIAIVFVVLAVLIFLFSAFYTVQPEERGVVLRLGKYRGAEHDAQPGLRFRWPLFERVYILPVERQLKQEFGFRAQDPGAGGGFRSVAEEATMLTGDENVATVEWVVQYRIVDPYRYLFRVRNVELALRDLSEAVMRKVVGDRTVNEVVTVGRVDIERDAELELQALADQYETGISIEEVLLQSNNPPDPVKPSFNDVNQAEQDRNKLLNEAQAQYNQVIPRADGERLQTVEQAEGYATDRVNRARGDAARFQALFAEYNKAREVTRKRLYLETMSRVLPRVGRKIVVDREIEGLIPMLNVDGEGTGAAVAAGSQGGNR